MALRCGQYIWLDLALFSRGMGGTCYCSRHWWDEGRLVRYAGRPPARLARPLVMGATFERASGHCRGSSPHAGVLVDDAQQNRPKRCARHCTDDATRSVPRRSREECRDAEMRTLLSNRKLLKRELVDIENH